MCFMPQTLTNVVANDEECEIPRKQIAMRNQTEYSVKK